MLHMLALLIRHTCNFMAWRCIAGGMNGSIIYELDRPENAGLSKSVKVLTFLYLHVSFILLYMFIITEWFATLKWFNTDRFWKRQSLKLTTSRMVCCTHCKPYEISQFEWNVILLKFYRFNFVVSWADLIAVAGAEAVALCGGPTIPIRIGRVDSR